MQTVFYPRIYLIGALRLDMEEVERYLDDNDLTWKRDIGEHCDRDLELATEFAGRVCYNAFGAAQYRTSNRDYIDNILRQKHGSVLEHATVMLLISGVSRSLTHELIRHRVGVAYSQRSQRYVDESFNPRFVMPPELARESADDDERINDLRVHWTTAMQSAALAYETLTELLNEEIASSAPSAKGREKRIRAKQAARSVLPNAMETTIVVTANMRALRHICEARGGVGAESEIRRLAVALYQNLRFEAPNIFADMEVAILEDGVEGIRVKHSKV